MLHNDSNLGAFLAPPMLYEHELERGETVVFEEGKVGEVDIFHAFLSA